MNPPDGRFNYLGSLATWLALCSVGAKSTNSDGIYETSDKFIADMCQLAQADSKILPSEIPHILIPDIPVQELFTQVDTQRGVILDMLAKGEF